MQKQKEEIKFVDCPTCESKVGAKVLSGASFSDEDSGITLVIYLLKCPVCNLPICAVTELDVGGTIDEPQWEEGPLERVWHNIEEKKIFPKK